MHLSKHRMRETLHNQYALVSEVLSEKSVTKQEYNMFFSCKDYFTHCRMITTTYNYTLNVTSQPWLK